METSLTKAAEKSSYILYHLFAERKIPRGSYSGTQGFSECT